MTAEVVTDVSHLQQLVRELAVSDAGVIVTGAALSGAIKAGPATEAVRGGAAASSPTRGGTQVVAEEAFDQISYTCKQIIQLGKEQAFTEQLASFISRKDAEIERMCSLYYQVSCVWLGLRVASMLIPGTTQEFVQSIDQLLRIRLGTSDLKSQISTWNREIQQSGNNMLAGVGAMFCRCR
jgi:hypothetical protein